ncbi:MAG TPA: YHS domain-containing protein [Bacteroidia bacterium]|jgi:YHS domain-containing protein|nr:YHS domain-containing protein [Bacteroidia bacterium]
MERIYTIFIIAVLVASTMAFAIERRSSSDIPGRCIVCGMKNDGASVSSAFGKKNYYFDSKHCLEIFHADPEKFIGKISISSVEIK